MKYRIDEASFELPDELHDQSVNIFTEAETGPSPFSIVMTRGRVEPETGLAAHVTAEIERLGRTLEKFVPTYRLEHVVDGRPAEITGATFANFDATIHQRQVFMITGARSVTITASAAADFTPDQLAVLNRLIQTFRFES